MDRKLPKGDESIRMAESSPRTPTVLSRRMYCYSQRFNGGDGDGSLRDVKDGDLVTVEIGRVRPVEVYVRRRVRARKVTPSEISNNPKIKAQLRRTGCKAFIF